MASVASSPTPVDEDVGLDFVSQMRRGERMVGYRPFNLLEQAVEVGLQSFRERLELDLDLRFKRLVR